MRGFSKGQAAIALSLAIPALMAGICLCADSWVVWNQRAQLQGTVRSAVLLGVAYLPANPAKAERVASLYAGRCKGVSACPEITFERVSADRRSLTLVVRRKARYFFGWLPGSGRDVVVAKATAVIGQLGRVAEPPSGCRKRKILRPNPCGITLSRRDSFAQNLVTRMGSPVMRQHRGRRSSRIVGVSQVRSESLLARVAGVFGKSCVEGVNRNKVQASLKVSSATAERNLADWNELEIA
jgi:hypothetical protein